MFFFATLVLTRYFFLGGGSYRDCKEEEAALGGSDPFSLMAAAICDISLLHHHPSAQGKEGERGEEAKTRHVPCRLPQLAACLRHRYCARLCGMTAKFHSKRLFGSTYIQYFVGFLTLLWSSCYKFRGYLLTTELHSRVTSSCYFLSSY